MFRLLHQEVRKNCLKKKVQDVDPSLLATFLKTYMKLLRDKKAVEGLQELIDNFEGKDKNSPKQRTVRKLGKHKKRTGCEMRLTTQIGEYEMDQVILDLGSNANILPKQTWEMMGRPMLQWSPLQLCMASQQKIIPMGRLYGVTVNIGASALVDFEVIEIVDDNNPYPMLLGIDWAFNMDEVINLKKRRKTFEKKALRFIVPLDPAEGAHYTEPVRDYEEDDDLD